jgi:beta-lactamase superfamily II metal-dependent hydrolase
LRVKGEFFQALQSGSYEVETDLKANEISSAILLRHNGVAVLLGGDATRANWHRRRGFAARTGRDLCSRIVKLPHHGSRTDSGGDVMSDMFVIDDARSSLAVISADGKKHPHSDVIDWLLDHSVDPFCTNYFHGWGGTVRSLFHDPGLDPELNRVVNEVGDVDLSEIVPCHGDITVSIRADGAVSIRSEFDRSCGCKAIARRLFG